MVTWLVAGLLGQPASAPAGDVRALVAELGSEVWLQRQRASAALAQLGPEALPALRRAYGASGDPEVRRRLRAGLEALALRALVQQAQPGQAFLGVGLNWLGPMPDVPDAPALVVSMVVPDSPASAADLRPGDRILALDGQPVGPLGSTEAGIAAISGHRPGDTLTLRIVRDGEPLTATVTLGHRLLDLPEPQRSAERRTALEAWWQPSPATQPATAPTSRP